MPRRLDLHPRLVERARSQHGLLTARQLGEHHSTDVLTRMARSGVLVRVLRGAYAPGPVEVDAVLRLRAVELLAPARYAGCLHTAADVLGFGVVTDERLHLTPRDDRAGGRWAGARCHDLSLGGRDLARMTSLPGPGEVWVTSPWRTAADLARLLPRLDAIAVLDAALARHPVVAQEIEAVLDRQHGRRGVCGARALVPLADPGAESAMESRLRLRVLDAGLPRPVCQHPVHDGPGPRGRYRLDLAWPERQVAAEYDGAHHLERAAQRADHERRNQLRALGWQVYVFTDVDVYSRPERVAAVLGSALVG